LFYSFSFIKNQQVAFDLLVVVGVIFLAVDVSLQNVLELGVIFTQ